MKATLEFNLPEEATEYEMANQAADMFSVISSLEERLRSFQKYGHEFKTADEAVEVIRSLLHAELDIRNVNIYE